MAKARGRGVAVRVVDRAYRLLTRFGRGASYRHLLSVRGRRSGRVYTTPVDVMELEGRRWLVAAYGPGSWVKNARAAGEVVLSRGLTGDRAFEQWMDEVSADAGAARRNAAVIVHDRQGQPIATFTLVRAWPRRLEYTGLRSGGTEPLTERLVLVHEGFDRA